MNWKTKISNKREVLTFEDFQIIPCKNGRCKLREGGKLRGTFTDAAAAKAQVAFIVEQRAPKPAPVTAKRAAGTATGTTTRTGTRKTIFGHSACAVLKALGRSGIKYPQADAILKSHGIEMPKASISVQLGFGRNEHTWQRHGKPADLTAEQMKELVGDAHD